LKGSAISIEGEIPEVGAVTGETLVKDSVEAGPMIIPVIISAHPYELVRCHLEILAEEMQFANASTCDFESLCLQCNT
jgi:hypothetical protein